ncbi:hypothetical protein ACV1DC_20715, partial [Aeromonas caviae]
KQAGKWDQETIVSFFLCQYCSGEYLPGLFVLISLSIIGIIVLSLEMADSGDNSHLMWPIMILAFITYNLISLTAAVLGFTFRDD